MDRKGLKLTAEDVWDDMLGGRHHLFPLFQVDHRSSLSAGRQRSKINNTRVGRSISEGHAYPLCHRIPPFLPNPVLNMDPYICS